MPFTFDSRRLTEEQRRAIWSEGFPNWCVNGFDVYFGRMQKENILFMSRNSGWWSGSYKYVPSRFLKKWIDKNYPEFEVDMRNLAEIMVLEKDDYGLCADYLTFLYREKGSKIRTLAAAEFLNNYLEMDFPNVSRPFAEEIGVLMMEDSWPNNLRQDLLEKGFESDVAGFWNILATSVDEFLGLAVRCYRENINSPSIGDSISKG